MPTMKDSRDEAARNMLLFAAAAQKKDSASDSESDEEDEDNRKQPAVIKQEGARKKREKDKGVVTPAPVKILSGNDDDVAPLLLNALQMVAEAPRESQGEMLRLIHENSPSRTNKKRKAKMKTTGKKNSSRGGVLSAKETVVLMEGGGQQQRQAMIDGPSHISSPLNLKPSYSLPRFNLPYESRMNAYSSNTVISVSKQVAEWDEMKRAAARARKAKSRANQLSLSSSRSISTSSGGTTEGSWEQRYNELIEFKRTHGHCEVPQKYAENTSLGTWVNKQRTEQKNLIEGKNSSLNDSRLGCLQAIGFRWTKRKGQARWDEKFNELLVHKAKFGNCHVPTKYKDNTTLGRWVSTQRAEYKKYQEGVAKAYMNVDKIRRLESIGFAWCIAL